MAKKRQQHSIKTKAAVAMAAIKEEMTLAEISRKHSIHPTQIQRWKQLVLQGFPEIFSKTAAKTVEDKDREIDELYKHTGQLKVELDWLKKNPDMSIGQMRGKIDFMDEEISISRQCELPGLSRSTLLVMANSSKQIRYRQQ